MTEIDTGNVIPARTTDPATSHHATSRISIRANSQRAKLLAEFAQALSHGLTDEQAMENAHRVYPFSEYAKRCSELRAAGLIEPTGHTRLGNSGMPRIVSRITEAGHAVVAELERQQKT